MQQEMAVAQPEDDGSAQQMDGSGAA